MWFHFLLRIIQIGKFSEMFIQAIEQLLLFIQAVVVWYATETMEVHALHLCTLVCAIECNAAENSHAQNTYRN